MTTKLVTLIYTDEDLRGEGTASNIYRRIPKLYTLEGALVCELDDVGDAAEGRVEKAALWSLGSARGRVIS